MVNSKPLTNGMIVFRPLAPGVGSGGSANVKGGNYQLDKVPLGRSVFTFSGTVLTGNTIPGPGGNPEPERVNVVPQKVLQEGVERTIEGDCIQDFLLEGPT